MLSTDPATRPNIAEIAAGSRLILTPTTRIPMRSRSDTCCVGSLAGVRAKIKLGAVGKWKFSYLRLFRGKLFVFTRKEDTKARHCYQLSECSVQKLQPEARISAMEELSRSDSLDSKQAEPAESSSAIVKVEHKEIETMYIRVEGRELELLLGQVLSCSAATDSDALASS